MTVHYASMLTFTMLGGGIPTTPLSALEAMEYAVKGRLAMISRCVGGTADEKNPREQ